MILRKITQDAGTNWSRSNDTAPTGRVLAGSSEGYGVWYSDQVIETTVTTKYLNKPAVQELVTQFKAYVQSKK